MVFLVGALAASGWNVVVTGAPAERSLCALVAAGAAGADAERVLDLGGATSLGELAEVLAGAGAANQKVVAFPASDNVCASAAGNGPRKCEPDSPTSMRPACPWPMAATRWRAVSSRSSTARASTR